MELLGRALPVQREQRPVAVAVLRADNQGESVALREESRVDAGTVLAVAERLRQVFRIARGQRCLLAAWASMGLADLREVRFGDHEQAFEFRQSTRVESRENLPVIFVVARQQHRRAFREGRVGGVDAYGQDAGGVFNGREFFAQGVE